MESPLLVPSHPLFQSGNLRLQSRVLPVQKLDLPLHILDPTAHLQRRQARFEHEPSESFFCLVLCRLQLRNGNEDVAGELREVLCLPLDRAVGEEGGVD